MDETDVSGCQGNAAVSIGAWSSIFQISLDYGAVGCKLASYLVMAACQKLHLDEPLSLGRTDKSVAQSGQLGIFPPSRIGADKALVHFLVPCQPVLQQGGFRLRA